MFYASWYDWTVIKMANPFIAGAAAAESGTEEKTEADEFSEYAWDFDHDSFRYDDRGKPIVVTGNEALKVWVYKLLKSERYRYLAYFDDYGLQLEKYQGKTPNNGASASAIYGDIREALLVNKYITSVQNVALTTEGKVLTVSLKMTTVYGNMSVEFTT